MIHGDEWVDWQYIPKIIDICLIKLGILINKDIKTPAQVIEGFLLRLQPGVFEFETHLAKLKHELNMGKWDHLNDIAGHPI